MPEALLKEPASLPALIARGTEATRLGDLKEAREDFLAALSTEPENFEARLWLCRIAYREFDWRDLRGRTEEVLRDRPDHREAAVLLARACTGLADWQGAARAWGDVIEDRPDWPEALYQQARALIRLGDRSEAIERAARIMLMEEGRRESASFSARIYLELNCRTEAREALAILYREAPDVAAREVALMERRNDLRGLAIAARARAEAQGRPEIDSSTLSVTESLFASAIRRERSGDLVGAFDDYSALLVLTPEDGLAERSAARIARDLKDRAQDSLGMGDDHEALEAFAAALCVLPKDSALRRNYGRLLMKLRDHARAEPIWRSLASENAEDVEAAIQRARALERAGRLPEAAAAWRLARSLPGEHHEAEQSLSTIARRMIYAGREAIAAERFSEAYAMFRAAGQEDPGSEEPSGRLAQVARNMLKSMRARYKSRHYREILREAETALDLMNDEPEAHLLVARAAEGMGRHQVALRSWGRLLELDPTQKELAERHIALCKEKLGFSDAAFEAAPAAAEPQPEASGASVEPNAA